MVDYYKILNLPKNAMPDEIEEAYRKYAPVHIINSKTDETFKYICRAYEVLSCPETRSKYDKDGYIRLNFTDPKVIFDSVFYPCTYVTRHFSNRYPLYNDLNIHDNIETSKILGKG